MSVGIEACAKVRPVLDAGSYYGCCLLGNEPRVYFLLKSTYTPVSSDALIATIQGSTPHFSALAEAAHILHTDVGSITSIQSLHTLCVKAASTLTQSDITRLKKLAVHLNFRLSYFGVNPHTIDLVFRAIRERTIPPNFPLHPSNLFSIDIPTLAFSAFGSQAPSFMLPIKNTLKITPTSLAPPRLVYRLVPIATALEDFRVMIHRKFVHNNPKVVEKKQQWRELKEADEKTNIWNMLRQATTNMVGDVPEPATSGSSSQPVNKKRKVDDIQSGESDLFDF